VKTYRASGVSVGISGPRVGFLEILANGRRVDPVKYAHIVEFGRAAVLPRNVRALSDGADFVAAKAKAYAGEPFMRPTFDEDRTRAQAAVSREIAREIYKGAAK